MEKKFELANVPCGTLLIQFEFISVSQAPALETDIEEAKEALIQTEMKRLTTKKEKKASSKILSSAEVAAGSAVTAIPEKFEWRQSSPGKVVDSALTEPTIPKKKKPLGRRIASVFRSKHEKERKKMAKMEASYEESESDDDDDIDETLETNRKLSAVPEETGMPRKTAGRRTTDENPYT